MSCKPNHDTGGAHQSARAFVKSMKRDPSGKGFSHLGTDGVFRTISSASGDYEVLDARGLNPEQIQEFLAILPPELAPRDEDFRGVDGTKVTSHEGLFDPAPGILPKKPNEEEAAERRKLIETHNRALWAEYEKANSRKQEEVEES